MNQRQNQPSEKSLWDLLASYGSAAVMFSWGLVLFFFVGSGIAVANSLFDWGSPAYVITILLFTALAVASIWASKLIKVVEKGSGEP